MNKFLVACAAGAMMVSVSAVAADGKAVYDKACVACHASGAAGAPRIGDKAAWAPRIAQGMDKLYGVAVNGKPGTAMLPKGTCAACTEPDLKAAVDYMVSQSK
ncbi:MAG: cytochrome c5 family protein [Gammaproteobacteria bacterium HGW-Gammaproteobacteria-1]|jgi:cytochrome c5|nr:MAG: cytochrome c5 family protein [Gammaproteobacteria bacterium HGW-Gammaproteobacteria-1]